MNTPLSLGIRIELWHGDRLIAAATREDLHAVAVPQPGDHFMPTGLAGLTGPARNSLGEVAQVGHIEHYVTTNSGADHPLATVVLHAALSSDELDEETRDSFISQGWHVSLLRA